MQRTLVQRFTLDPGCPAASMVASSDLQEFRGELDVVEAVLYDLNASFSGIIFRPCIAVEVVPLVTSVSCLWNV